MLHGEIIDFKYGLIPSSVEGQQPQRLVVS